MVTQLKEMKRREEMIVPQSARDEGLPSCSSLNAPGLPSGGEHLEQNWSIDI
jgi:hypothetical protein